MATRYFRTPDEPRGTEAAMPSTHGGGAAPERRRWLEALDCNQETRTSLMHARYTVLAELDSGDIEVALRQIIAEELTADEAEYRRLTSARLNAWATLAREDADGLGRLGRAYDAVFATLAGSAEFRRVTSEQAVLMQLSEADQDALCNAVPGMRRFTPLIRFRLANVPRREAPAGGGGSWLRRLIGGTPRVEAQ